MFVVAVDINSIKWFFQDMMFIINFFKLKMHIHFPFQVNVVFRLFVIMKGVIKKSTVIHKKYFITVILIESYIVIMG